MKQLMRCCQPSRVMPSIARLFASGRPLLGKMLVLGWGLLSATGMLRAEPGAELSQAQTSEAVKQSAIQMLPLDKLDAEGRAKVRNVLSNITIFRRLPVRVVDCDPDLYLFWFGIPTLSSTLGGR